MKKMKKILAMLLALTMVLGMGLTSMASGSATITVNDAEDATLTYVQVIEPDTTSVTGWKFSDSTIQAAYTEALGAANAQTAIAMLVKYVNASATLPSSVSSATAATATQIDKALSNLTTKGVAFSEMVKPQTVSKAGVYAIKAAEEGYTYKTMAAYVGFGAVEEETYPTLQDAEITAKKATTTVTKSDDDTDNAVAIGQTVRYTIETEFPYFDPNATEKSFVVFDTITGAEYANLTGDTKTATVTINGTTVEATFVQNGNRFAVDLSAYIDESNTHATQPVVVSYDAVVTELTVENGAGTNISGALVDSNKINLYTGRIELTKFDEDGETTLEGAGFNVYKDASETALTFDVAVVENDTNVYTYNPAGNVTEVVTGTSGKLVVQGLDIGKYHFEEVTAPEGYSINEEGADAELSLTATEATAVFEDETNLEDTRLVALPSTGGIGTTIFTVAGCGIMVAAAYLFFASRKKEN